MSEVYVRPRCVKCDQELYLAGEMDKGKCVNCYNKEEVAGTDNRPALKDHKMIGLLPLEISNKLIKVLNYKYNII